MKRTSEAHQWAWIASGLRVPGSVLEHAHPLGLLLSGFAGEVPRAALLVPWRQRDPVGLLRVVLGRAVPRAVDDALARFLGRLVAVVVLNDERISCVLRHEETLFPGRPVPALLRDPAGFDRPVGSREREKLVRIIIWCRIRLLLGLIDRGFEKAKQHVR